MDDINDIITDEINILLNKKIDNIKSILVLSGGAIKGVAQIGALQYLEENNMLKDIKIISATSAGSIIGFLYMIGYSFLELFDFMKIIDMNNTKKINISNIFSKYGLDDGNRIIIVIKKLMNAKQIDENITFNDLFILTNKSLIITGTCINDKKVYYFNYKNYPEMKVLDAIRISISIPIIMTPCMFEGKMFVDGACIDNFPISIFENKNKIIGIYVTEEIKYVDKIKSIDEYLINLVKCIFEGVVQKEISTENIIVIRCNKHSESQEDIIEMFEHGYNTAKNFMCNFH